MIYIYTVLLFQLWMVVGDNFVQAFLERFENLLGIFLLIAKIQKQDGEQ